ncbi:lipopolysaccharide biosynthesis protein [Robinsoniella peoriensis]
MSRAKDLAKNTIIITIGRISTQFITFLLLPLYTALLSTEEYGTVDLITTIVQLLIPVVSLMVDQGVFRYLLTCENEIQKKRVISNAFFILVVLNSIFIFIYFMMMPFITSSYKIWIMLILVATSFSNLFLQIARGLKQTPDYAIGSFICSVITIVLNVLCIAYLRTGAVGMLFATLCGNIACCLFLAFRIKIINYLSVKDICKQIGIDELKYSIPLVPNQLSLWVMNSSDRLIVAFFLGTASNGILAVSHKFPAIFMTFFNIFQLAWHETGAVHFYDEDRDEFFSITIEKIITLFSTLCMGIIIVLPIVFNWFVNTNYNEAYYNIPIYLIASLFNVVVGLLGVVYVATKKTFEIAKTTILAAVINIIVNLLLIKYLGLYAASISTFIGYFVTMIYRIIDTKKYLNIKYNIKQYIVITISIVFCTFIYYLNNRMISIIILPLFCGIALWINKDSVSIVKSLIKKKVGK